MRDSKMTDWKQEIRQRLADLKLSPTREAEILEELSLHTEDRYEDLLASGLTEREASRAALSELSENDLFIRDLRRGERRVTSTAITMGEKRRGNMIAGVWQDLRYCTRSLLKKPGFTAVVVITLALGIGANTAIFSVVNSVLLRPLPYPHADQIVRWTWQLESDDIDAVSELVLKYWKDHSSAFEAVGGYAETNSGFNLAGGAEAQRVRGLRVSEGFFRVLGTSVSLGRTFSLEEDQPNGPNVAIISDSLWRSYYTGDRAVLGKSAIINGRPYTIIGILPPNFRFETQADVLLPLQAKALVNDDGQNTEVIARINSDLTREQAQADVARLLPEFRREFPKHLRPGERGLRLNPYQLSLVGDASRTLWLVFGAVGFVLLIACSNVANLLLARGIGRKSEVAIRLALGASRRRIMGQLLIESWLLAFAGSLVGVALAFWSVPLLLSLAPPGLPRLAEIRLNYQAVLFAVGVSFLTTLLVGIVPALRATRLNLSEAATTSANRSSASKFDVRARGLLVVSQFALSFVLLVGATLLIKSFLNLRAVETGFNPRQVTTAQISMTSENYKTTAQVWAFQQQVLTRISVLPGVEAVATASSLPLERGLRNGIKFNGTSGPETQTVQMRAISPQYFRALGIPVLHGREFNSLDTQSSAPVVIINQTLKDRYWPNRDPSGELLSPGGKQQIVGVVRDIREIRLDQAAAPTIYMPTPQVSNGLTVMMNGWFPSSWIVRTSRPVDLVSALRAAVKESDPQMPIANVRTLTQVVDATLQSRQFVLLLMGVFAGLALLLTAVGIYGVLSYQVSQRTNEIGIRMALGAQRSDVFRLVLRQGLVLAVIGVTIGLAGASALTRLMTSLLFGVTATDVFAFTAVSVGLLVIALLASYLPARRATKIDPLVALRYE
jgi:putative ABC transport system permease protein